MWCLPNHVQDALASTDISDLESLGARADDIMVCPCHLAPPAFNAVTQDHPSWCSEDHLYSTLYSPEVCCLFHRDNPQRCTANQWNSDQHPCQDNPSQGNERLCYYHKLFGLDTRRCKGPCALQSENPPRPSDAISQHLGGQLLCAAHHGLALQDHLPY